MSIYKQLKDKFVRAMIGREAVPAGLVELHQYFRVYKSINFRYEKQSDGSIIAISDNFAHGTIITRASNDKELVEKVKDAILTAFEVPSSYADEAAIRRTDEKGYAFA